MNKIACISGLALCLLSSASRVWGSEPTVEASPGEATTPAPATLPTQNDATRSAEPLAVQSTLGLNTFAGLHDSASKAELGFAVTQADLGSSLSWQSWQAAIELRALGSHGQDSLQNRVDVRQAFIGFVPGPVAFALGRLQTGEATRWGTWSSRQGPDEIYGGTDGLALSQAASGPVEYRVIVANAIGSSSSTMQAFGSIHPDFSQITTQDSPKQGQAVIASMKVEIASILASVWLANERNRIVQQQTENSQRTEPTGAIARRFEDLQASLGYQSEAWSLGVWMRRTIQSAAEKGMVESGGQIFTKGSFLGGQVKNEYGFGAEMDWAAGARDEGWYSGFGYQVAKTATDNLTVDQQIQEDKKDSSFVSIATGFRNGPFSLSGNLGYLKAKGEIFRKKGELSELTSTRSTFFLKASLDLNSGT